MDSRLTRPLVFILDVDGTIIGNISPQITIYEMKKDKINIKYALKDLWERFDHGLLRPYFDSFLKITKKNIPNAEFFIYTSSDDQWGAFIVSAFEKYCSFRFNRPLLTRKNCYLMDNQVRKSLKSVTPVIKRSLQKKYGKNIDLTNRIMIIDNCSVYQSSECAYVLKCPTYKFYHAENLPALISEEEFKRHKLQIKSKLQKLIPHSTYQTYYEFQKEYYKYYLQWLEQYHDAPQDKFWFFLTRLLEVKNIRSFAPQTIAYINRKLSKRLVA
jgi:hypothetical protein